MVKVTLKSIFYTPVNLEKVKPRRDRDTREKNRKLQRTRGDRIYFEEKTWMFTYRQQVVRMNRSS